MSVERAECLSCKEADEGKEVDDFDHVVPVEVVGVVCVEVGR